MAMPSGSHRNKEKIKETATEESHNASQDEIWVTAAYTQTFEIILSKTIKTGELESLPTQFPRKAGKWRAFHGLHKGAAAKGTLDTLKHLNTVLLDHGPSHGGGSNQ